MFTLSNKSQDASDEDQVGCKAGRALAEKWAAEEAKPAQTLEESAWRRFHRPERTRRVADDALKAAIAAGHLDP